MPANDKQRRSSISSNLKSAITTAALLSTIGGWAVFGTQQTAVTTPSTPAVAQVAASAGTAAQASTTSDAADPASASASTAAQASTDSQSAARQPVAVTRSSR